MLKYEYEQQYRGLQCYPLLCQILGKELLSIDMYLTATVLQLQAHMGRMFDTWVSLGEVSINFNNCRIFQLMQLFFYL